MAQEAVSKDLLVKRLKRIEGQIRGIQKMIEDGRDCEGIIMQLAAVRSAIEGVGCPFPESLHSLTPNSFPLRSGGIQVLPTVIGQEVGEGSAKASLFSDQRAARGHKLSPGLKRARTCHASVWGTHWPDAPSLRSAGLPQTASCHSRSRTSPSLKLRR